MLTPTLNADTSMINLLMNGSSSAVHDFFFVRMREAFAYIGQYYSPEPVSAEEVIGEAYELLSADDWHKLRIFKGTCSLTTYVTVIVARHFQHKRNRLFGVDDNALERLGGSAADSDEHFMMEDVDKILSGFKPLDRLILQRVMIDGEKPGDILDEVRALALEEKYAKIREHDDEKLAGYVYLRYHRAKLKFRQQMEVYGYGR